MAVMDVQIEAAPRSWADLNEERRVFWEGMISGRVIPSLFTGHCRGLEHLEDCEAEELIRRISSDPVLSSKVLLIANSTRAGKRNPLKEVGKACRQLGVEFLQSIVLTYEMENDMRDDISVSRNLLHYIRNHSALSRVIAGIYTESISIGEAEAVQQAALLNSVTTLLLAQTPRFDEETYLSFHDEYTRLLHEEEQWGVCSPVLAGRMMQCWGLVEPIPAMVGSRHLPVLQLLDPEIPRHEARQICLVAIVNALAHAYMARNTITPEILLDRRNYTILKKNLLACGLYVDIGRHWGKRSTELILRAAY